MFLALKNNDVIQSFFVKALKLTNYSKQKSVLRNLASPLLLKLSALAFPLMLSSLSGTLMLFVDRMVLSYYSTQAMNAVASASLIFAILQFTSISIATIAEVFVGQYNGAKQYQRLARPVWQMIWFSIMTLLPFCLCGALLAFTDFCFFLPPTLVEHGKPFLSTLMFFGSLFPLNASLASFFIGQGKVKLVTVSIIITSVMNLILLLPLVFGFGSSKGCGTLGAALATGFAQFFGLLILTVVFLNKKNRAKYHTHRWHFDYSLFKQCLNIGVPNAVGHMIATVAWALVMILLAKVSMAHITIYTISQTLWQFFNFITDGIQKAVSTLAANFIGANQKHQMMAVLKAGVQLQVLISFILLFPLVFFPHYLVQCFLPSTAAISHLEPLYHTALLSCQLVWISLLFDGLVWVISGILTAAGDTRFIMVINAINAWVFGIIPVYLFMIYYNSPPIVSIYIIVAFSLLNLLSFVYRFKDDRWQEKQIFSPEVKLEVKNAYS